MNGQQMRPIPASQRARFKCPNCKDEIFEIVQRVRFITDRLDPEQKLAPIPVQFVQCAACKHYIVRGTGDEPLWVAVEVLNRRSIEEGE